MTELSQFSHSIDIAAPPRVVFTFLTTEEGMTAWMGQFAELDPQQGGRFAVDISGYPVRGQYLHVEPYSRVVVSREATTCRRAHPPSSSDSSRSRAALVSSSPIRTCPIARSPDTQRAGSTSSPGSTKRPRAGVPARTPGSRAVPPSPHRHRHRPRHHQHRGAS